MSAAWAAIDLPARPCEFTYCAIPLDDLPPIEAPHDGSLAWLPMPTHRLEWAVGSSDPDREFDDSALERLIQVCAVDGLTLPESMVRFLGSDRRNWIRSATGCWLDLSERVVTVPDTDISIVRFLNDQQGSLHWYLALNRAGERGVIASGHRLDSDDDRDIHPDEPFVCAGSFEEFLYRYWLENEIYFRTSEGAELTPDQAAYLAQLENRESQRESE